jgi:8-oxo-dGTP diphosphatase
MLRVAIGLLRDEVGHFLVARRPEGKPLSGLWEFPGGKIEPSESSRGALVRELREEIGVEVLALDYLTQVVHGYDDGCVCLDVWWVMDYRGEPSGCEGQVLSWVMLADLLAMPVPGANKSVLAAIEASSRV